MSGSAPQISLASADLERLRFDEAGLIPMVVQDVQSGTVLMVGWANRQAVALTIETQRAHFFSRSRQTLWRKGETSSNELVVREIAVDCDRDTLLVRADPRGPTCHTGGRSCFDDGLKRVPSQLELGWLAEVVASRARAGDANASYTARLLAQGVERVAQKVGEEAVETVIAAVVDPARGSAEGSQRRELVGESADLLFHLLVLLEAKQIPLQEVAAELRKRHSQSDSVADLEGDRSPSAAEEGGAR